MSKSALGYAPFEGFSKGDEGGSFANASKAGSSPSPAPPSQTGEKAPSSTTDSSKTKKDNGSKNGNSNKNDNSNKTAQKGGRRKRRRTRSRNRRRNRTRGGSRRHKRRSMPDKGWSKLAPFGHARTVMKKNCGKKCFLGPKKSFPICAKGTCKRNRKGIEAAYVRARQWGKKRSSYKSKGKYVTYHGKKGTRRVWMKGSRPRHRRSVYQRVARRAKSLLRRRRRR